MKLNGSNYCLGCMRKIPEGFDKCSCGYDESSYREYPQFLPAGTILNGSYMVGRVLGTGGFGITYLGVDLDLDLKVAIKEFYISSAVSRNTTQSNEITIADRDDAVSFEKNRDKFIEEAKVLARLHDEPGVVMVHKFFQENNTAYIVMEFLEGESLGKYLKRKGNLSTVALLQIFLPLMDSLTKVHELGLIHRDISPDNIMITKSGNVKLLDFGAARESDTGKSMTVMLKHGFAPFEQYMQHGKNQGPWTDVYALGATMYYALTGEVLPSSMERASGEVTVKMPSDISPIVTKSVSYVIMKAIEVHPEDRYASIAEFKEALAEAGKGLDETQLMHTGVAETLLMEEEQDANGTVLLEEEPAKKNILTPIMIAVVVVLLIVLGVVWFFFGKSTGSPEAEKDNGGVGAIINNIVDAAKEKHSDLSVGGLYTLGEYDGKSIDWIVLENDGVEALLMSKDAVSKGAFQEDGVASWENCDLRIWLNSTFYNEAFSDDERKAILLSKVYAAPAENMDPGNDTEDYIYILSSNEADRYFSDQTVASEAECDYSYWTRSFRFGEYGSLQSYKGTEAFSIKNANNIGVYVRPVMRIKISSLVEGAEDAGEALVEVGDVITFGNYHGNDIDWVVLKTLGSKAMVMATKSVEKRIYNSVITDELTWNNSELREWLNKDFINETFLKDEVKRLVKTEGDYVSILSQDDIAKYHNEVDYFEEDDTPFWLIYSSGRDYAYEYACVIRKDVYNDNPEMWEGKSILVENPTNELGVRPVIWVDLK